MKLPTTRPSVPGLSVNVLLVESIVADPAEAKVTAQPPQSSAPRRLHLLTPSAADRERRGLLGEPADDAHGPVGPDARAGRHGHVEGVQAGRGEVDLPPGVLPCLVRERARGER